MTGMAIGVPSGMKVFSAVCPAFMPLSLQENWLPARTRHRRIPGRIGQIDGGYSAIAVGIETLRVGRQLKHRGPAQKPPEVRIVDQSLANEASRDRSKAAAIDVLQLFQPLSAKVRLPRRLKSVTLTIRCCGLRSRTIDHGSACGQGIRTRAGIIGLAQWSP